MANKKFPASKSKIQGFSRVAIAQNGDIVGDSGWTGPNTITQAGFQFFLAQLLVATTGSSQVTAAALGTGTAPAWDGTALPNEITADGAGGTQRCTLITRTFAGSAGSTTTARLYGTFNSTQSFLGTASSAAQTIKNIGLFAGSAVTAGTIFAGNTYATSSVGTNQDVYWTYDIRFS